MGKNGSAEERSPVSEKLRVDAASDRRTFFKFGAALTAFAGSVFVPAVTRGQTSRICLRSRPG